MHKNIAVIVSGYIGLPTSVFFAKSGLKVSVVEKIAKDLIFNTPLNLNNIY